MLKEILKERLKVIDLTKNEKIVFFDGSSIQNQPNSSKSVCKKRFKKYSKEKSLYNLKSIL